MSLIHSIVDALFIVLCVMARALVTACAIGTLFARQVPSFLAPIRAPRCEWAYATHSQR